MTCLDEAAESCTKDGESPVVERLVAVLLICKLPDSMVFETFESKTLVSVSYPE